MKKLILITILLLPIFCHAQKDTVGLNLPYTNGKLIYEGIVDVNNKSKNELFTSASQWFVDFFKSSKDVIQSSDKESGIIIGKGSLDIEIRIIGISNFYPDEFTIQVNVKDNKYRYRIYDMVLTAYQKVTAEQLIINLTENKHVALTKNGSRKALADIDKKMHEVVASLNSAMIKKDDF